METIAIIKTDVNTFIACTVTETQNEEGMTIFPITSIVSQFVQTSYNLAFADILDYMQNHKEWMSDITIKSAALLCSIKSFYYTSEKDTDTYLTCNSDCFCITQELHEILNRKA
jgi:hypothetical protein